MKSRTTPRSLLLATDDALPGWHEQFSKLAIPSENDNFTPHRIEDTSYNLSILKESLPTHHKLCIPITGHDINSVINQLKGLRHKWPFARTPQKCHIGSAKFPHTSHA